VSVNRIVACVLAFLGALPLFGGGLASVAADSPPDQTPALPAASSRDTRSREISTISLRRVESRRLVLRPFDGPYWRIGPLLQEVRAYAEANDESGPLIVRFSGGLDGPAASGTCEVGFIAQNDHIPSAPFLSADLPACSVGSLTIPGQTASTHRDHRALQEWARQNGFETTGEVIELYHLPPDRDRPDLWETEVQLMLTLPANGDSTARPWTSAPPAPTASFPPGRTSNEPTDSDRIAGHSTTGETAAASIFQDAEHPDTAGQSAEPIGILLANDRFDRIAERIVPDRASIPADDQVWLGQFVFRLEAARKGVRRIAPQDMGKAWKMVDAIVTRYRRVYSQGESTVLAEPVTNCGFGAAKSAGDRAQLMRDLDRLLGRIALQAVTVEQSAEELLALVERASVILNVHGQGRSDSSN